MKLKAAVRYQVTNLLALLLVFSGIIGALLIMGNIVATSSDRKSTRLNSSHIQKTRMPSSA